MKRVYKSFLIVCLSLLFSTSFSYGQQPAGVDVDKVRLEPMQQTMAVLGRFVPRQSGEVATRLNERVDEVLIEVGDHVKKGDILVKLSSDRLQQELNLRVADYKKAEAQIDSEIAAKRKSKQALDRAKKLQGSGAFRQDRVDDLERELEGATSAHSVAEAELIRARSQLTLAQIALRDASIRAPYPGVITVRHVVAGKYVRSGDAIVTLLNHQDLEIEADVPVDRLSGLNSGATVEGMMGGEMRIHAVVRAVVPEDNTRTRTRAVRLMPDLSQVPAESKAAANQNITLMIPVGGAKDVVSVHKDAITIFGGQKMVYVVEEGIANIRPVKLGTALGTRFEVLGGLRPGDLVVIRGNERLRPGQAVKPTPSS